MIMDVGEWNMKRLKTVDKTQCRQAGRAGMTLVETVIAVSIFGMCIAGFVRLFAQTRMFTDSAREHYTAANIAKNRMERIGVMDFSLLGLMVETNLIVDASGFPDTERGRFRRTTSVTSVASNLSEVVVSVDIQNRYKLNFSTNNSEELRTYFTKYLAQ